MSIWLPPIIAFILGSIPFGLIIARANGVDIRKHGSGNIGATNVLRTIGKKPGILCFILDFLKGLIPALIGYNLYQFNGADDTMAIGFLREHAFNFGEQQFNAQAMQLFTGLCAILGHNFSPWVNFKGGKGIATSAGVVAAFMPLGLPLLLLIFFITFKLTRYVSVASMVAAGSLPIIVVIGAWVHGKLAAGTWNKPLLIFALFIALMAIWKHRSNIKNILAGKEYKFTPKNKS